MKNLITTIVLIFGLITQAQKSLKIFNYTANNVTIQDLVTRSFNATSFTYSLPEFHSKPSGAITIAPYGTYTLLNTSNALRFPFYAPVATGGSLPAINSWERITATGNTIIASTPAWIIGSTQVFYWIQLGVGANSKQIGIVGSPASPGPITSNGWTATYTVTGTTTAPVYTITIQ